MSKQFQAPVAPSAQRVIAIQNLYEGFNLLPYIVVLNVEKHFGYHKGIASIVFKGWFKLNIFVT